MEKSRARARLLVFLRRCRRDPRFDLRLRDDFRFGTFLPLRRASASPIAIACLRLVTFFLLRPLLSVPFLRLRIARSTSLDALLEYFLAMTRPLLTRCELATRRPLPDPGPQHKRMTAADVPLRVGWAGVPPAATSSSGRPVAPLLETRMRSRRRADLLLVERGLFATRAKAQAAIAAGLVTADDVAIARASEQVATDAALSAQPAHPWVSRGGVKLAAALDRFGFDPGGRVCLDVGASTGGFTEVLLARGAGRVYAVDVGRDQLDPRLTARPEITSFEQTDIRDLDPARLPEAPDLV